MKITKLQEETVTTYRKVSALMLALMTPLSVSAYDWGTAKAELESLDKELKPYFNVEQDINSAIYDQVKQGQSVDFDLRVSSIKQAVVEKYRRKIEIKKSAINSAQDIDGKCQVAISRYRETTLVELEKALEAYLTDASDIMTTTLNLRMTDSMDTAGFLSGPYFSCQQW